MEIEYYQGSTKGKITYLTYMLLAFPLYLLFEYVITTYVGSATDNTSESIRLTTERLAQAILFFGFIALAFYTFLSVRLYKFYQSIKSHSQYPPPGSNFPFTVKLIRGEKAIKHANSMKIGMIISTFIGMVKFGAAIYFYNILTNIN